ncbi:MULTISPECIES: fibronectin type III domain-containing protein [unclassified Borrelia]|uniref:fibronectin type III domain-containing protein n=1 Tax=unclassified Borrelia TaxID=2649934 RepID=UPI001E397170|nr:MULTISPECIES: fibronectin type III domain-containing protein [unclassified Borrelia]UGQ16138.1 fibronectin type III domain-containing protein [Borrelia sp. RT5S]UGQ17251.1 fibronectin type III domain-containing protein [Borrelia sp. RT1S]
MRLIFTFVLFFLCIHGVFSQELKLILDSKDGFKFIQEYHNVSFEKDSRGILGIYLDRHRGVLDVSNVDLRLEIEKDNLLKDTSLNYFIDSSNAKVSNSFHNISGNSLIFYSSRNTLRLKPVTRKAFFYSGNVISDFTIQFWLYRTTSVTGEMIVSWNGYKNIKGAWLDQAIRLESEEGTFVWSFNNVFLNEKGDPVKVKIKSDDDFVPKEWHLHTIRYKQKEGLLEYLIDSRPQAIEYITNDRREGSGYLLSIGNFIDFTLGQYFTGAIENFEIHKSFEEVSNAFFSRNKGYIVTEPIRLSKDYSQILSIDFDTMKPRDTEIVYYYRLDNKVFYGTDGSGEVKKNLTGDWIHFDPKIGFPGSSVSKYIQLKVEFYPNGNPLDSPALYSMMLTYIPEAAPFPPVITKAVPSSGEVFIEWVPVINSNIVGYYIYIGISPGNYHGKSGGVLSSPIDVGNKTAFKITGLEDGRLYYISVASYSLDKRVNETSFSKEISVRPMEIFKRYE